MKGLKRKHWGWMENKMEITRKGKLLRAYGRTLADRFDNKEKFEP